MADRKQKLLEQASCDFSRFLFGVTATSRDTKSNETVVKTHRNEGVEPCQTLSKPTSAGPLSVGTAAVDVANSDSCITEAKGEAVASSSAPVALQSPTALPIAAAATGPCDSEGRAPVDAVATVAISYASSCRVGACEALSSRACEHASSTPDRASDFAGKATLSLAEDCAVRESESTDCRASAAASMPPIGSGAMLSQASSEQAMCEKPTHSATVTIVRGDSSKDESDVVMLSSSPPASEAADDGPDCVMLPDEANDCSLGQEAIVLDTEESDSLTTSEDEDSSSSGSSSEALPGGAIATVVQKNAKESPAAPAPMPSSFEAVVAGSPMTKREVKRATGRQQQPAMTKWRQGKGQSSPEASDVDADESPEPDSDSDSLDEMPSSERKDDRPPKTKGELAVEDLPPIKELQISVPETVALQEVGTVRAIVDALVVVQSRRELSALDIDTVLFLEGRKPMGKIFEVFGPVPAPLYSVRFNSAAEITSRGVAIGLTVFYAPSERKLTRYVFVEQLKTVKGSDASWKDNNEPPREVIDYSDDEKERQAKSNRRRRGRPHDENDAAAYERPTADAEITVNADAAAENNGYSHTRRGRGRGSRARPFSTPERESTESFIVPGANAARWGRGGKRGGHASQHDWSRPPPPSLPGAAAGNASPFSVPPPPLPAQAMQHQPYGQSQHWGSPAPGPAGWHHPPPWPQVKQEPCEQGIPECRATAWSQAQQSTWPPAQAVPWHQAWEQQYVAAAAAASVSGAAYLANGDGVAAAATAGPTGAGKGAAGKRGRAAVAAAAAQPATARLPFIIDTRYVQNSQQSTDDGGSDAAPSAGVKPCSNWPDYDD